MAKNLLRLCGHEKCTGEHPGDPGPGDLFDHAAALSRAQGDALNLAERRVASSGIAMGALELERAQCAGLMASATERTGDLGATATNLAERMVMVSNIAMDALEQLKLATTILHVVMCGDILAVDRCEMNRCEAPGCVSNRQIVATLADRLGAEMAQV